MRSSNRKIGEPLATSNCSVSAKRQKSLSQKTFTTNMKPKICVKYEQKSTCTDRNAYKSISQIVMDPKCPRGEEIRIGLMN
jgi:hypothetical protein